MKKELGIKDYFKWVILVICLLGFILITRMVFESDSIKIDEIGYSLVSKYLISDNMTPIYKFITQLGGPLFLMIITILIILFIKNKEIGICIFYNFLMIIILNISLKNVWQRSRPIDHQLISETGYSFPSGHSMLSLAFYGFLIYLVLKYIKNKYVKIILTIGLGFLIVLIGISRIYLGVHYTSDVMAGYLLSIIYLILYITLVNKYGLERD